MVGITMPMDIAALEENAQQAVVLLKALANKNRLMILCSLADTELSVGDLNARVSLAQSALSQHLATLRREGFVTTRRESQTIYYRLASEEVRAIIGTLHQLYCGKD